MKIEIIMPSAARPSMSSRRIVVYIIALIMVSTGMYACKSNKTPEQAQQTNQQPDSLLAIRDTLQSQYNAARIQIDGLSTQKAALDSQVAQKDVEIAQLKGQVAHLGKKSKTLEKKLKKDDSFLASIKNELSEKEKSFGERLGILQSDKDNLNRQLTDLMNKYNSLKELGSVLHASNIRVEALHLKHNGRKEKKTAKARKLNVLRVYFDIDENRIAEDGTKKLYLAITGPDGKMLSGAGNSSGTIAGNAGSVINYSMVKEIALKQNEPVKDVTVDWKQEGDRKKGVYSISIYNGGYRIGGGSVALM